MSQRFTPRIPGPGKQTIAPELLLARWLQRFSGFCSVVSLLGLLLASVLFLVFLAFGVNGHGQGHGRLFLMLVQAFTLSIGIGFSALLLASFRSLGLGWLGILFGLLFANFPLCMGLLSAHLGFSAHTQLLAHLYHATPGLGVYLLVVSIAQLMAANIYYSVHSRRYLADQFEPEGAQGKRCETSFIPKCWEMYSCPDAVRSRCPNYTDQVNCWQRRIGCLCDRQLSTFLFMPQQRQQSPHHLDLTYVPDLENYSARIRSERPRPWRVRRQYCHNCAVFLEHQGYKYRRLNWIFLPITLLLVASLYRVFDLGYYYGLRYLEHISKSLTATGHLPAGFTMDAASLINSPYEYVLLTVLALLLMSYVIELTDKCLLEWKW